MSDPLGPFRKPLSPLHGVLEKSESLFPPHPRAFVALTHIFSPYTHIRLASRPSIDMHYSAYNHHCSPRGQWLQLYCIPNANRLPLMIEKIFEYIYQQMTTCRRKGVSQRDHLHSGHLLFIEDFIKFIWIRSRRCAQRLLTIFKNTI